MEQATVKTSKLRSGIVKVMKELKRLEKASHNKFADYHFTSVDDFKDALRPLMADHGLELSTDETDFTLETVEGKQKTLCAKVQFSMTLSHCDGETGQPERVTVLLPYTGAQTTGAARSYAIKEWLKTKFLASSGDLSDEADLMPPAEYHTQILSKAKAKPLYEALQRALRDVSLERNPDSLMAWGLDERENINQLPADWQQHIRKEFKETLTALKANEGLDRPLDAPVEMET